MIYTLTLSPSVDLLIKSDNFELEKVNRYNDFEILPGGKGLNASIVLKRHNFDNVGISLFDSNTFLTFTKLFNDEKVNIHNINASSKTRINIKYYGNKESFELNGPKTILNDEIKSKIINKLKNLVSDDIVFIMGISDELFLKEILLLLNQNNVKFILDIDTPNLKDFLVFEPFLIKPNLDELKKNFNFSINNEKELINCLKTLQNFGAKNIIVSMDKNGSYLLTESNKLYKASIIKKVDVISATAAGDTMVSIFAANYLKTNNAAESLKLASSAAAGTVNSRWLGDSLKTKKFLSYINVEEL
ncbi:PfkB family carbohydrate kinase [Mycoplasmopsis cynos]|uniref:PfkB family carbohydrate kinase n=1 Tax=Mycoplasmopsis cynos TaxID=171284 RepID=UPI002AFFEC88|nr:PfkB family carbohydrate kinase [Mycoplasmopsis cynos]WQQ16875.1 PfkB family carbohydrate kinase [Mycoplasmopsis cynos]